MKKLIIVLILPFLICACAPWTGAVTEQETASPVYTDRSKLTDYEPPKSEYKEHAGYKGGGILAARDDYGTLLSYVGAYAAMEQYITDEVPMFGLVTDKGELVTDPIYSQIVFYEDFLILYRGVAKEVPKGEKAPDRYSSGKLLLTLAASDGSWIHELNESEVVARGEGVLMTAGRDKSLDVRNKHGELIAHFDFSLFEKMLGKDFVIGGDSGNGISWMDDKTGYLIANFYKGRFHEKAIRLYLDFGSGKVLKKPPKGYPVEIDYDSLAREEEETPPDFAEKNNMNRISDAVTGEKYYCGHITDDEGRTYYTLYDSDGNEVIEKYSYENYYMVTTVRAGLLSIFDKGTFCLNRIEDGETIFRYVIKTNYD